MPRGTINTERAYALAREKYAEWGVDTVQALDILKSISISLHCWQGDDVTGFENHGLALGGGLAVTGNYPGKARNPEELRSDLDQALSCIPGKHRLNLHASYGEFAGQHVDRNEIEPKHFQGWISWAKKERGVGLDFNPTYFAHPKSADGFTLAHPDRGIRKFWIEHGILSREVAAHIGKALGQPCVNNLWIPDGMKDSPVDRKGPRERLENSLDAIYKKPLSSKYVMDAVEPKLFGIGSESYVVGSHEFYLGYAITRKKLLCLDSGHFHPTENVADKISSVLQFLPSILLHISRGLRWDSDHVVTFSDDTQSIAREVVANNYLGRVHIGLDYFDASINRVAAWVIGARNVLRAFLNALLEPVARLRMAEAEGDFTTRLALQEENKSMPSGAVWDYFCEQEEVPVGLQWLAQVKNYESSVLSARI